MKILVIGGTRFFGKDIVNLALEAGHDVTVFSRGNQRPDFWDRVDHILGDRENKVEFAEGLANRTFDLVIDNIAYRPDDVRHALNVLGGKIGRYLLTTSVAVYIGTGPFDQPVRESDANLEPGKDLQWVSASGPSPKGLLDYAAGKIAAERALIEQVDVPYTIIRPSHVVGPEDNLNCVQFYFQRLMDGEPLILTNGGVHSFQPVYRRDLANAYLLALDSSRAVNEAYTIAQTKTCRLVEWVEYAATCLGVRSNLLNIPADVIDRADFTYAEPHHYTGTMTIDVSKAVSDLKFQATPIESWTETTARWYRETVNHDDSRGYEDRAKEVELARRYLAKIEELASKT